MKKIISITLMAILCFMFLASGVYANGKPSWAASVNKEKGNSQKAAKERVINEVNEPNDENEQGEENEQGDLEGTVNQAKNRGQAKKLEERIKVRGMNMKFDIPPVIKEGRTLIPVRAIMNGLGATVQWDAETKIVTITRGDVVIVLDLNTGDATINGTAITIDVPAQLISNRTFVPLRFVAQSLGENVDYDEETGDIDIGDEDTTDEDTTDEDTTDEDTTDEDTTDEDTTDEDTTDEDTTDEDTTDEDTTDEDTTDEDTTDEDTTDITEA